MVAPRKLWEGGLFSEKSLSWGDKFWGANLWGDCYSFINTGFLGKLFLFI